MIDFKPLLSSVIISAVFFVFFFTEIVEAEDRAGILILWKIIKTGFSFDPNPANSAEPGKIFPAAPAL